MIFERFRRLTALTLSIATILSCAGTVTAKESGRLLKPSGEQTLTETEEPKTQESAQTSKDDSISVKTIKSYAKDYDNIPDKFLKELSGKSAISIASLKKYAAEYQLPSQFLQRFFKDCFVFKNGKSYQYVPIEKDVPKNKYNLNNVKRTSNGEAKYIQDGISKGIKGIDVSEYQGDINWKKVKADGVKFAFIRVGYRGYLTGKIQKDDKFEQNMKNATAAGVKVGVYFFSQAVNKQEAIEEAKWVLKQIKGYDLDYPVVFDIEGASASNARTRHLTKQTATQITSAFCDTIKKAGYRPMIYTYTRYFVDKLDTSLLSKYDMWLAQYYEVPFFPYKMQIWQYGSTGRVDGIKGNVDMNIAFTGKYE